MSGDDHDCDSIDEELGERLLGELRARGIAYLSGGHEAVTEAAAHPMADAALLRALARYPDSRVRNAAIGLLLLHPALVSAIPDALHASDEPARQSLITLALAALYMSHLWRTRLRLALGQGPELPADLLAPQIAARAASRRRDVRRAGPAGAGALRARAPWPAAQLHR